MIFSGIPVLIALGMFKYAPKYGIWRVYLGAPYMVKWDIHENYIWLKIEMRDRPGQTLPLAKEKEKEKHFLRRNIFDQWRRRRMEKGKEENI